MSKTHSAIAFLFFCLLLMAAAQNQPCYTCTKAHVRPGPGFGLAGCPATCTTSCTGSSTSSVVSGACTTNVADSDCEFTNVPNFVGVSQNDRCTVNATITCPAGQAACIVLVTQTPVSVPDCKTVARTVSCVRRIACDSADAKEVADDARDAAYRLGSPDAYTVADAAERASLAFDTNADLVLAAANRAAATASTSDALLVADAAAVTADLLCNEWVEPEL